MSVTPSMLLELPVVSTTIGPEWASMLNDALELVDAHDHSTDSGVKITPAGMNINATLEINSQDITEVNSLSLDTRASAPSTLRALYSKSGDLYFKNTAGTEVQVTNGGTIAGTPGSITNLGDGGSSAVFSDINEDFTWYFDGVKPAAMNMGDIRLYPFDGSAAYTNFVTLKSPTSLASNYSITMPGSLPGSTSLLTISSAGVLSVATTTGSGSTVLATSPTIETPVLTTPAITGGTQASPTITTPAFAGVPTGTITAGTYTPTISDYTNSSAGSTGQHNYIQVGNIVFVTGFTTVTVTAGGDVFFRITVPIATANFASGSDGVGVGRMHRSSDSLNVPSSVGSVSGAQTMSIFTEAATAGANATVVYSFSYEIQ